MKRYIKYIAMILAIVALAVILIVINNKRDKEDNGKFKIVTSFYPIYVMTANITEGAENIELVNMTEINAGCVHNYTLTTMDMKKIEHADVFIENGLGLENFIDKIVNSNKDLKIIDTSQEITNLMKENDEVNPHIWTSISNYIKQVENVTQGLKESNPENASIYEENSKEYIQELKELQEEYNALLQQLRGETAVTLNESFEYWGRDLGLNLTTIHTSHEESAISAENLKNVIDEMKQNNTKMIIVDVNDNLKNAETIANETGAKIYKLNSGVEGSLNKDAYIQAMKSNLEIIKSK